LAGVHRDRIALAGNEGGWYCGGSGKIPATDTPIITLLSADPDTQTGSCSIPCPMSFHEEWELIFEGKLIEPCTRDFIFGDYSIKTTITS